MEIVILGGVVGNVIEWYDFALFGYFSPVISNLFFPSESEIVSLLQTYGVFAAGFIMRPLGGVVFGYIGDRIGRRTELFLSVLLMAVPTFLLGVLPVYEQIGIFAPIALTLLRLLQGLSVGGEFTGSVTYVAETAPPKRRGFATSFANVGSMVGMLLGLAMVTVMTYWLPDSSLQRWGWRLPFLLGGILGLVGFYIRRHLPASELFEEEQKKSHTPLIMALRQHLKPILQTMLFSSGYSVVFYLPVLYFPIYLDKFTDVSFNEALLINTVAVVALLGVIPLAGWVSDRWLRRKPLLLMAMVGCGLSSYPAFVLAQQDQLLWIWVAQIWLALLVGILVAVTPAMMVELFPTVIRLTGYSLAFSLGGLFGGTSPLVATWLVTATGNVYAPAIYLVGSAGVAAIALSTMPDRSREPLL